MPQPIILLYPPPLPMDIYDDIRYLIIAKRAKIKVDLLAHLCVETNELQATLENEQVR